MQTTPLPFLDEHATLIEATPDDVWRALVVVLDRAGPRGAGARLFTGLLGCADRTRSGPSPLASGSTIPGFRVATADAARELVLEGRHRFSSYALTFRIDHLDGAQSRLRAESRATFPGLLGGTYGRLLTSLGLHVRAVRLLLSTVRRRAEGPTSSGD